jgi:hypothetical protein
MRLGRLSYRALCHRGPPDEDVCRVDWERVEESDQPGGGPSSTPRIFAMSPSGVKGLGMNAVPSSTTP